MVRNEFSVGFLYKFRKILGYRNIFLQGYVENPF